MPTYTVQMQSVANVVEEMTQVAQQIQTLVDNLDSETQSSLADWTSAARDVYNQARAKWDNAARDMGTQAGNASAILNEINNSYQSAENRGVSMWQM